MSLELSKLTEQVEVMGQAMADRRQSHAALVRQARTALTEHGAVTDDLRRKISAAHQADVSWRGADPLGERLDERCSPALPGRPATLLAADGSQIYPDRHGIAADHLLNTGSIALRQGSGLAPTVDSRPELFFSDADLYDESGRPRDAEYVNSQRDRREIESLARLAEDEREALGGDAEHPCVAVVDGPMLLWAPQRTSEREVIREVHHFTSQLDRLRRACAIPLGYVDRPSSANVLRTIELAGIPAEEITRDKVRTGPFRRLTDRLLFADLEPNQRSALFASTSELNDRYKAQGHHIAFFYLNVARRPGTDHAIIARVELPAWAASDPALLDLAQQVIYADCTLTGFPYVLIRAHELAVVGVAERADLEAMVGQAMLRHGLSPLASHKAEGKMRTGGARAR